MKATGTYLQDKLYSNVDVNYTERETLEDITYSNELSVYTSDLCAFLHYQHPQRQVQKMEMLLMFLHNTGKINFLMRLISYFITGSRTVVELRTKYSPSGSYTKLLNIWINTDSKVMQFQMIKTN